MRKYILLILLAFASTFAYAYNFQVDGIYYNIVDKNNCIVEVTYGDAKYSGSVTIPATVKKDGVTYTVASVGISAFSNCAGLTEVKIGDGVELIYNSAFSYCTSLESVTLGSNVKKMGNNAFSHCSSLSNINLNDQIVKFGDNAFEQCTSLTSVVIGSKVEEMGSGVFQLCTNLKTVEIHEGASDIGSSAFEKCEKLTSVTIPNSVLHIGLSAFFGCSSLTEVKIGDGVETISNSAFSYCTSLNKVSLGSSVKKVNSRSFEGCNKMTSFTVKNPNPPEVTRNDAFSDYSATLYVPSGAIGAYKAHEIWKKFYKIEEGEGTSDDIIAFADPEVKRICVENWDTNGDGELSKTEAAAVKNLFLVFITNHKIESFDELQFFTGLTDIYGDAFFDCFNLKSIIIPGNVKSIGGGAFYDCSALHSLVIGNGVERIGEEAFYANSLSDINIPNSVMWIERMALTVSPWYYNQPEGLVYAGKVLYHYKGTMPDNTQIKIKEGTLGIAQGAFDGCSGLTSFTIPNSVTAIGEKAFRGTAWYNNQPEGLVYAGKVLYEYKGTMPESSIIDIKEGTLGIAELAFEDCEGLFSVIIPNSIECIGKRAFYNCSHLTTIISHIQDPFELDPISFCYLDEKSRVWSSFTDATLYVPVGTKAKYEATEGWKEFKNIVEGEPDPSAIQSPTVTNLTDIYSISGHKVRSNATSLEGLPKGIYIVNGKKVIK